MQAFFRRRTAGPEEAFDRAAETFAAALAAVPRLQPGPEPAQAWLFALACNKLSGSQRIAGSSPGIGDLAGVSSNVFTVRIDGAGLVKLTHNVGGRINDGLDSWSPDGKKIAAAASRK